MYARNVRTLMTGMRRLTQTARQGYRPNRDRKAKPSLAFSEPLAATLPPLTINNETS